MARTFGWSSFSIRSWMRDPNPISTNGIGKPLSVTYFNGSVKQPGFFGNSVFAVLCSCC